MPKNTLGLTGGRSSTIGAFSAYQTPLSTEFFARSLSGIQPIALSSTEIYNANGAAAALGCDLADHEGGYLVLFGINMMIEATTTTEGTVTPQCREGTTASTVSGGGLTTSSSSMRTQDVDLGLMEVAYLPNRPAASRLSEWGIHGVSATIETNKANVVGGTLVVLPAAAATFSGPNLGVQEDYWGFLNQGSLDYDTQVGADADQTFSGTITVPRTADYVCFWRSQTHSGATSAARSLRFQMRIDGVDVFGVKTGTATGGATRTGRGFQYQQIAGTNLVNVATYFTPVSLHTLAPGTHTVDWVINRHETTDNAEQLRNNICLWINTDVFKQFKTVNVATVQTAPPSRADIEATAFAQSITVDGNAKVLLILSTSSHSATNNDGPIIYFKRNGVIISGQGVLAGSPDYPQTGLYAAANGTAGTADSDNNTYPVTVMWVDDPGVGTHTYTVWAGSGASGTAGIWNANDNGASGFKGRFMIAELSLATAI
jgi:hypothetical protein